MSVAPASRREVVQLWRRQVGQRARLAQQNGPRPLAVISYRIRGPADDDRLVPLRRVTFFALFDDRSPNGDIETRLVGVAGTDDGNRIQIGGPHFSRIDKDVRLAPARDGVGRRFDAEQGDLLSFALQLECYLQRAARHLYMPRRRIPRLPTLSFAGAAQPTACVDLTTLPKRQIIAIDSPADGLCGQIGQTTFDFYHTRFRSA